MSPYEVLTKVERVKTPWVAKMLQKSYLKQVRNRAKYGNMLLAAQDKAGHLKENWADLGVIQHQIEREPVRPSTPAEYRTVIIESISRNTYVRMIKDSRNLPNAFKIGCQVAMLYKHRSKGPVTTVFDQYRGRQTLRPADLEQIVANVEAEIREQMTVTWT